MCVFDSLLLTLPVSTRPQLEKEGIMVSKKKTRSSVFFFIWIPVSFYQVVASLLEGHIK